jgi:CheY-like chemotaxis protein
VNPISKPYTFTPTHAGDLQLQPCKRVILVEDDQDMAEILSTSISDRFFCRVDVVNEPFEAMTHMMENFYDLIIMDWNLPRLNAGETLVELDKVFERERDLPVEWETKKVPVVVLSGFNREFCRVGKTKHFSYVGFVTKRKPLDDILSSLEKYIR